MRALLSFYSGHPVLWQLFQVWIQWISTHPRLKLQVGLLQITTVAYLNQFYVSFLQVKVIMKCYELRVNSQEVQIWDELCSSMFFQPFGIMALHLPQKNIPPPKPIKSSPSLMVTAKQDFSGLIKYGWPNAGATRKELEVTLFPILAIPS